jgi:DNA-binding response OmpR family regulator
MLIDRWPNTTVLFMTGYPDDELRRRGINPNGLAALAKPFDTPELAERVRAALGEDRASVCAP